MRPSCNMSKFNSVGKPRSLLAFFPTGCWHLSVRCLVLLGDHVLLSFSPRRKHGSTEFLSIFVIFLGHHRFSRGSEIREVKEAAYNPTILRRLWAKYFKLSYSDKSFSLLSVRIAIQSQIQPFGSSEIPSLTVFYFIFFSLSFILCELWKSRAALRVVLLNSDGVSV